MPLFKTIFSPTLYVSIVAKFQLIVKESLLNSQRKLSDLERKYKKIAKYSITASWFLSLTFPVCFKVYLQFPSEHRKKQKCEFPSFTPRNIVHTKHTKFTFNSVYKMNVVHTCFVCNIQIVNSIFDAYHSITWNEYANLELQFFIASFMTSSHVWSCIFTLRNIHFDIYIRNIQNLHVPAGSILHNHFIKQCQCFY